MLNGINDRPIVPEWEPYFPLKLIFCAHSGTMSGVKNVIGPNLKRIRKDQKLTQEALVAKLHIEGLDYLNRISITKIESQIRNVTDYELQLIAKVLKVSADDLLPSYYETSEILDRIIS